MVEQNKEPQEEPDKEPSQEELEEERKRWKEFEDSHPDILYAPKPGKGRMGFIFVRDRSVPYVLYRGGGWVPPEALQKDEEKKGTSDKDSTSSPDSED